MELKRSLILASSSPRRQFLMKELGYSFTLGVPEGDESFSSKMEVTQVPLYLAQKKASTFKTKITQEIVMTADTVVVLGNTILNKPVDREDAIRMLTELSGQTHLVITAVCLLSAHKTECFEDRTEVTFRKLTQSQIEKYVDVYKPLDKAGSYGAQECLPQGVNPCSEEEINFLKKINKLDLIAKSLMHSTSHDGLLAINKIDGSYFNVMGLPIHKVHEHLQVF
jgi:septum formation protein